MSVTGVPVAIAEKTTNPSLTCVAAKQLWGGGRSNYGRVVGIVGLSHTGRRVAHLLRSFDLTVLASDPYATEADAQALGTTLVPLPDLLHRSDIVPLHAPSLPETRNLLNADRLALLPDHATVTRPASRDDGPGRPGHGTFVREPSEWALKVTTVLNARILTGPRPEPLAR
ncbi:NAD(P)-dependent oxidoreductase [Nonomuraea sp. NPDC049129]|uniref:NAD(P)-dependent oxidoreductase n=1 Tax=Nonomuraea sp. NPDC049129 TaxID=3155272 RepID=UPI0033F8C836